MEFDNRKNLSSVIEMVIKDRVYKFNQEEIDMIIKILHLLHFMVL